MFLKPFVPFISICFMNAVILVKVSFTMNFICYVHIIKPELKITLIYITVLI